MCLSLLKMWKIELRFVQRRDDRPCSLGKRVASCQRCWWFTLGFLCTQVVDIFGYWRFCFKSCVLHELVWGMEVTDWKKKKQRFVKSYVINIHMDVKMSNLLSQIIFDSFEPQDKEWNLLKSTLYGWKGSNTSSPQQKESYVNDIRRMHLHRNT